MDKKIFVYGASIAWGAWDNEGGWVERLHRYCNQKIIETDQDWYRAVYNLSISGDTSGDVRARFEREFVARKGEGETFVCMFAIGINDSQWDNTEKVCMVPVKEFEKNVIELIAQAQNITEEVLFLGLTPVDESRVDPVPWKPGWSYTNDLIKRYNTTLQTCTEERDVVFVDVNASFEKQDYTMLLEDGLHPNTKGHEVIYDAVLRALDDTIVL